MNKTLKLACIAMLTALSVALNFATIEVMPNQAISFTIAVCFLAGIYFGPLSGFVVGYIGDLIAHLISPRGAYNWFMATSCALFGVICALIFRIKTKNKLVNLSITAVICLVVCVYGLNTFGLWMQYSGVEPGIFGLVELMKMDASQFKKTFWVYLVGRLLVPMLNMTINALVVGVIMKTKVVDKIILKFTDNKKLGN